MGVLFRRFSIFPSWSNAEVLFLKNNTSFLQALMITHWVFTWTWSSLMCYKIPTQRFICSLKMWFVSYETKCCCFIPSLLVTCLGLSWSHSCMYSLPQVTQEISDPSRVFHLLGSDRLVLFSEQLKSVGVKRFSHSPYFCHNGHY